VSIGRKTARIWGSWGNSSLCRFIYVYVYVHVNICICTALRGATHRCVNVYMCMYMHMYINIYAYIYVNVYAYVYIYICTWLCICTFQLRLHFAHLESVGQPIAMYM
jgi:hypothetical protein